MADITAKLVSDYFTGNWACEIFINGEHHNNLEFLCEEESGKSGVPHVKLTWWLLSDNHNLEAKDNQIIVVWRSDLRCWVNMWYNESGGYNELQWTSQEEVNGNTVLYGYLLERLPEGGFPNEYIAMCELQDQNSFKYTILSYRKGILEMFAKRTGGHVVMNSMAKEEEQVK